jgi:hypothetical protein
MRPLAQKACIYGSKTPKSTHVSKSGSTYNNLLFLVAKNVI